MEGLLILLITLQIFGGFIASELLERHNNQFFGTGETFLFSLSPDVQCYTWTAEADLILRANDHELIIGSGGGYVNYSHLKKCLIFLMQVIWAVAGL